MPARLPVLIAPYALALATAHLAACDDAKSPTAAHASERAAPAAAATVSGANLLAAALTLPVNQSGSTLSGTALFQLTQTGTGPNGRFLNTNTVNGSPALFVRSYGAGYALSVEASGSGYGGEFFIASSTNNRMALRTETAGGGTALRALTTGKGRAGFFQVSNTSNDSAALSATTNGRGEAGRLRITNGGSASAALSARTYGTGWAGDFLGTTKGLRVATTAGGTGLQVAGGTKQAVVSTPSGAKSLYTEESSEVWFTDYGFGQLQHGRARILLDPAFAQTVNVHEPYHVFLQARGNAELYVGETTPLGFVVEMSRGNPAVEFSYRVVAKRLGFERTRLEPAPWADQPTEVSGAPRAPTR